MVVVPSILCRGIFPSLRRRKTTPDLFVLSLPEARGDFFAVLLGWGGRGIAIEGSSDSLAPRENVGRNKRNGYSRSWTELRTCLMYYFFYIPSQRMYCCLTSKTLTLTCTAFQVCWFVRSVARTTMPTISFGIALISISSNLPRGEKDLDDERNMIFLQPFVHTGFRPLLQRLLLRR